MNNRLDGDEIMFNEIIWHGIVSFNSLHSRELSINFFFGRRVESRSTRYFSLLISSRSPKTHCLPLVGTSAVLKRGKEKSRRKNNRQLISQEQHIEIFFVVFYFSVLHELLLEME